MVFSIKLDKDLQGRIKRTKNGQYYRFALVLKEGEEVWASIEGFRCDADLTMVMPPMTKTQFSLMQVVKLGKEAEAQILEKVKLAVQDDYGF